MALGVWAGAVSGAKAAEYLRVAKAVTYTCWQMYERMPSGAPRFRVPPDFHSSFRGVQCALGAVVCRAL